MDKLIKWLFQRTDYGATYLQVIIVTILLIFFIKYIVNGVEEAISEYRKLSYTEDKDV